MSKENIENIKPVLSVTFIILTLFLIVFFQMEERRLGYSLLKLSREKKQLIDEKRAKEVQLAKYSRPQLMDQAGKNKIHLQKAQPNQIIHLSVSQNSLDNADKEL